MEAIKGSNSNCKYILIITNIIFKYYLYPKESVNKFKRC